MNNYLISVIGPTAIGKTALAVSLAQYFKTEVISSDSRQFYREMTIGTAVPAQEERKGIPHHFIQHISIETPYSVGGYEQDALQLLHQLFRKYTEVILVGGSGLYTTAILKGLDTFPEVKPGIREGLNRAYEEGGIAILQAKLQQLDPKYYEAVDQHNPHRLIRALEVCLSSGKPYSSYLNQPRAAREFTPILVGLTADREVLYKRINDRVDEMMNRGLLKEAEALLPFRHYNALQTVGYQELFTYLEGSCTLEEAISEIKKNTRRFAKRQLTWYRKLEGVLWFDYQTPHGEIAEALQSNLQQDA